MVLKNLGNSMLANKCTINMMQRRSLMLLCVLQFLLSMDAMAQREVQYSQYMYGSQIINPAYAGNKGVLGMFGIYRNQWVGVNGAPESVSFFMDTPVGLSKKVGLGLTFSSDRVGPSDESFIAGDFSYSIFFPNSILSFGIKGGFRVLNVDYNKLNVLDPTDPDIQYNINGRMSPVVGMGVYLHNNRSWYLGVSAPTVIKATYYDGVMVSNATSDAIFYAMGGYVFRMDDRWSVKPAVLGRFTVGAPVLFDLSATLTFDDAISLGASYRVDVGLSNMVALRVHPRVTMGYAYDYGIDRDYRSTFGGSHEVFLRFLIGSELRELELPRGY